MSDVRSSDIPPEIFSEGPWPAAFVRAPVTIREQPGGFSGARTWHVSWDGAENDPATLSFRLRAFPPNTTAERVCAIHRSVAWLAAGGLPFIVPPLLFADGASSRVAAGRVWEVSRWLPGKSALNFESPPSLWQEAGIGLAMMHSRWRDFDPDSMLFPRESCFAGRPRDLEPAPVLEARLRFAHDLLHGELERIIARIPVATSGLAGISRAIGERIRRQLPPLYDQITGLSGRRFPIQVCVRDCRHEHFLFTAERLTGVIDFDAVRGDSVAGDLARILEPLPVGETKNRRVFLDAYEGISPLSTDERELIDALHGANRLLTGAQWLKWLYLEEREFPDLYQVMDRLTWLLQQMEARH